MSLVILPWVIRNYRAFDAFVPTSTQSGNVLAGAYNDEIYKSPWGDGWINPDSLYREQVSDELFADEIAYSNYQVEQGQAWILDNPEKLPKLFAAHVFGFVRPWFKITRNDAEFFYELISWFVGISLLSVGMWWGIRHHRNTVGVFALVILGGFLTGVVFFAIPRYRLPYSPFIALIEAIGAWIILRWLAHRKSSQDSSLASETTSDKT